MREIKFRFWDEFNAEMKYSDDYKELSFFFRDIEERTHGENGIVLMQCTGLKYEDEEAYCDDLYMLNTDPHREVLYKIVWLDKMACFALWPIDKDAANISPIYRTEFADAVTNNPSIGNIHENPELLKA